MNEVYLSLGSNEGDRVQLMEHALELLQIKSGPIVKRSAYYETKAWGLTDQPDFLNMCALVRTNCTPPQMLSIIHDIETLASRQREIKWGPRTLDIDILLFNAEIIHSGALEVPHPHMQERRFVLLPLAEIAGHVIHPMLQKSIGTLLQECPDTLPLKLFETGLTNN